jgi:hypothetical protein
MYVNGKMTPFELFQEWVEGGIKEDGGSEFKYNIL